MDSKLLGKLAVRQDMFQMVQKLQQNLADDSESTTDDELEQNIWDPLDDADLIENKKPPQKQEDKDVQAKQHMKKLKLREHKHKEQEKDYQNKKQYEQNTKVIKAGGVFNIQVHIIECRDLKSKDLNNSSDPVVTVKIFDAKKSTKIIKETRSPMYDQILYFDFNLEPNELSKGKAFITVSDASMLRCNRQIGSFEFDLSWIYFQQNHEIYQQWVGLTNSEAIMDSDDEDEKTTETNNGIEGYLRCSIVILGPNDEQYIHDDIDEWHKVEELQSGMILISPGITQTPYLLTVKVHKLRNLMNTDLKSVTESARRIFNKKEGLDPFVYVEYAGIRLRSDKVFSGCNPDIGIQFEIPVMEPVFTKDIIITVMDYDFMERNDRIGVVRIDYQKLKAEKDGKRAAQWYYIYGAPLGKQKKYARKMNMGLVEGTNFRGQILLELSVSRTETRHTMKRVHMPEYDEKNDKIGPEMIDYYVRCDLYEGTEINDINKISMITDGQMSVEVSVANIVGKSTIEKIKHGNAFIEWYQTLSSSEKDKNNFIGPIPIPKNWKESEDIPLPDVFIYLCTKEFGHKQMTQVSYCRVPLRCILPKGDNVGIWGRAPVWYDMKENLAFDKYSDHVFPGSLLIGLNAGPIKSNIYKPPSKKDTKHLVNVIVEIFEAQMLPILDPNGYSDPYVRVQIMRGHGKQMKKMKEFETSKCFKTLNPKWNGEILKFEAIKLGDFLHIEIYDWDALSKDEFSSYVDRIPLNGKHIDGWKALKISKHAKNKFKNNEEISKNSQIKMAISYEFLDPKKQQERVQKKGRRINPFSKSGQNSINKLDTPKRTKMELRVFVYQAKNLENRDLNGLSDAYFVVRFCGQEAKTKVIDNHIDPQWWEVLSLIVNVPWDERRKLDNAPRIYCQVFDYDYFQKDETLGRFSVAPTTVFNKKTKDPSWYHLENAQHEQVDGKVLVYFELIKKDEIGKIAIPKSIRPDMEIKWLHIITLGLRDVQSLFGVHKLFIEFEINGLLYKTQKSNIPSSRNPNFNQVLHLKVKLPIRKIFLPAFNLTIKDALFGGAIQREIGHASIDLYEYFEKKVNNEYKIEESNLILSDESNSDQSDDGKDDEKKENIGLLSGDEKHEKKSKWNPFKAHKKSVKLKPKPESKLDDAKKNDEKESKFDEKNKFEKYDILGDYELGVHTAKYMENRDELKGELEQEKGFDLSPFHNIDFFHGKSKKRHVGYFKGLISVTNSQKNDGLNNKYLKDVMKPIELFLRLYIRNGINLKPKDSEILSKIEGKGNIGSSDPYLIIKLGAEKKSTRNQYISNTLNPEFCESFEFQIILPGISNLKIEIWDYDGIGDDLIGCTNIDIEDRWYDKKWRNLKYNKNNIMPLEKRSLRINSLQGEQGKLEIWIEILTPIERKKIGPMIDIKPLPPNEYELRVIIWECKNVEYHDEQTEANDLYISGSIQSPNNENEENNLQETDMHFRSHNGFGSFNWRMKFPLILPKKKLLHYPRLKLQIWDKDFFTPSDNISECIIPLARFLRYAEINAKDSRCKMIKTSNEENEEKIWINLNKPKMDNIEKDIINKAKDKLKDIGNESVEFIKNLFGKKFGKGEILISIELLSEKYIKLLPAGFGRDEPNKNPYLSEPIGRHAFNLFQPCKMLRILLGDKLFAKICIIFCWIICIALIVFITPNLLAAIAANILTSPFL